MNNETKKAEVEIINISQLFEKPNLTIPVYQRPYKWQKHHVMQLLDDLKTAMKDYPDKSYRLGTVVLFDNENNKDVKEAERQNIDIVDGQQRIITLLLLLKACDDSYDEGLFNNLKLTSDISKTNVFHNFGLLKQEVSRQANISKLKEFVLKQTELVVVTIADISEAFQFFDSQNSRGKELAPHDLLKAYHLREFDDKENHLKQSTVELWEKLDEDSTTLALDKLFAIYLYRIKRWTKVRSNASRFFSRKEIDWFKGINLAKHNDYPYLRSFCIAHHLIDEANTSLINRIDGHQTHFPFQLNQPIINGRRFFEMISHYHQLAEQTEAEQLLARPNISSNAEKILSTIDSYNGRYRTGDKYVRSLFHAMLMAYYDKFGSVELSTAIERAFIWAYTLRLKYKVLQYASLDNYVNANNWFTALDDCLTPRDFQRLSVARLKKADIRASKVEGITELFEDMGQLHDQ